MYTILTLLACSSALLQEGYTEQGGYYVVFETNPDPIPFKEYFDVKVGIFTAANQESLVTDVDVLVDATMPEHEHGMNMSPIHSIDENGYTIASGLEWFMTGEWQLEFYVTPQDGGVTETVYFPIECCKQ